MDDGTHLANGQAEFRRDLSIDLSDFVTAETA
jgi:hypothetical protein